MRNSKVMKTVILHGPAGSDYVPQEDKLDFIFFKSKHKSVYEYISQDLANAIKKLQLILNFTNTTNIIGRIMPECVSDSFTSSLDVQGLIRLSMYHKSIKGGVVKVAHYGKYRNRKSQAVVKWLTSNITLSCSFCQKNCSPGYYLIYTGHKKCCWVCIFCENRYFRGRNFRGEKLLRVSQFLPIFAKVSAFENSKTKNRESFFLRK